MTVDGRDRQTTQGRSGERAGLPRWVWLAAGLVACFALLASLGILRPSSRGPGPEARRAPQTTRITTSPGLDIYPSLAPDGHAVAYASERGGFELFVKELGGSEMQLTSDGQHNVHPCWSPDGQWIAYHSQGRGGIWVLPARGGVARQLAAFGARPSWSPDGETVAFQSESLIDASWTALSPLPPSTIWVVPASGGEPPRALTRTGEPPGGHGVPVWTPDGHRLVFVANDRSKASLWSIGRDGEGLEPIPLPPDQPLASDPASCPGCDAIYYVASSETGSSGIWRVRLSSTPGPPEWVPSQVMGNALERVRHLSLTRDGSRLVYSAVSMTGHLASVPLDPHTSLPTGEPRPLVSGSGRTARALFSPDGRRIAFTGLQVGARSDIWVVDAEGRAPVQLTSHPATDSMPSWFPDGARIAFLSNRDGHFALWAVDVESRHETLLRDFGDDIDAARLSPDGTLVAFNRTHGGRTTNTWVAPVAGGTARQISFDREFMGFPCWSPDGRHLAVQMKRGDDTHLVLVPSEGGEPTQITFDAGLSWPHSWAPDGDKVAFAAMRDGIWSARWVSLSTREQRDVTSHRKLNAYVRYPAWSPRGDQMIYEYAETVGDVWMIDNEP